MNPVRSLARAKGASPTEFLDRLKHGQETTPRKDLGGATSYGMNGKDLIQLLPGTKKRLGIKIPGENTFLYIGSAIFGAVLVVNFALNAYEVKLVKQIDNVNEQLLALEQGRDKKSEQNLKTIKEQLNTTASLIKSHVYWTQGIQKIASLLQNQVQIESFSTSKTGTSQISIKAVAASYIVLAKQIASFLYDDSIKDVEVGKISSSTTGKIEFDIRLIFNDLKLIKK